MVLAERGVSLGFVEYENGLNPISRLLRSDMTQCERLIWSKLRIKQINGVQLYRQKPTESYTVDFYAPPARMVVTGK